MESEDSRGGRYPLRRTQFRAGIEEERRQSIESQGRTSTGDPEAGPSCRDEGHSVHVEPDLPLGQVGPTVRGLAQVLNILTGANVERVITLCKCWRFLYTERNVNVYLAHT